MEVTSNAENRIREMKTDTAEYDLLTIRRAAASNHPLRLIAARLRGWLNGIGLAFQMLQDKQNNHGPPLITCRELTDFRIKSRTNLRQTR
jgi:hypothetical protein